MPGRHSEVELWKGLYDEAKRKLTRYEVVTMCDSQPPGQTATLEEARAIAHARGAHVVGELRCMPWGYRILYGRTVHEFWIDCIKNEAEYQRRFVRYEVQTIYDSQPLAQTNSLEEAMAIARAAGSGDVIVPRPMPYGCCLICGERWIDCIDDEAEYAAGHIL